MFRLLTVIPNIEDATSLYRASSPLFNLQKQMPDLQLVFMDGIGENKLEIADACFMQRPFTRAHLELVQMCKENRIPVWVDYDDLLLDVPQDNPAHDTFMNPETQDRLKKITSLATVVTVTTEQLRQCLLGFNPQIKVIPNALPQRFAHLKKGFTPTPMVHWRGTNTHAQDMAEYATDFLELAQESPEVSFTFTGWNPWFITKHLPRDRARVVPGLAIGEYFRFMSALNPSIQVVPLASSMFNLCKSNIAYLEACLAGAVTVAPQWPEWQKPGCLTFTSGAEMKERIQWVLEKPEEAKRIQEQGWEYIHENLMLPHVNQHRVKLVQDIQFSIANGVFALTE